jgi:hypothetical protein
MKVNESVINDTSSEGMNDEHNPDEFVADFTIRLSSEIREL